ncbi:MAG: TerB family tellurite resistance protein [Rhodospirillales bacterium]|nr:TerB family tellurite resistance protein [Rhodospirillales bacterium]
MALFDDADSRTEAPEQADPLQRAAAVLLAIAARLDGTIAPVERDRIRILLRDRLGVSEVEALLDTAERDAANSTDFFGVTRVINDRSDAQGRIDVIEMLWDVAYADGVVDDYEANLVRRVAGLLHVSDRDAGEARKRVIERNK